MNSYKYGIYLPESYNPAADKDWPLILFLHGAGEKGNNLELLKRQGLPKYLSARKDFPFVVAYPQCPRQAHWHPSLLNEWLEEVLTKVKADKTRLYLTGISMGGYGTWHWAAANPEKFAAILPICGGGEVTKPHGWCTCLSGLFTARKTTLYLSQKPRTWSPQCARWEATRS